MVVGGRCSWHVFIRAGNLDHSHLPRFLFSTEQPCIVHGLVYISLETRFSLWSWPNTGMVTAFEGVVSAARPYGSTRKWGWGVRVGYTHHSKNVL